jgi:hypothetical protein
MRTVLKILFIVLFLTVISRGAIAGNASVTYELPPFKDVGAVNVKTDSIDGNTLASDCNSVSFWQLPDIYQSFFIGRSLINTDPSNPCSGTQQKLVLTTLQANSATASTNPTPNAGATTLDMVVTGTSTINPLNGSTLSAPGYDFFSPPQAIMDGTVISAYDASSAVFEDEIWVAFECVLANPSGSTGAQTAAPVQGASACVGPLRDLRDPSKGLDPYRTSVVIEGGAPSGTDPYVYSASTPKLLNFDHNLYVYWAAIKGVTGAGQAGWINATTRGAQLVSVGSGGKKILRATGMSGVSASPVFSSDPGYTFEIMGLNFDDGNTYIRAEVLQLVDLGNGALYAPTALNKAGTNLGPSASQNCPSDAANGLGSDAGFCLGLGNSQLVIAYSNTALGTDILNRHVLPSTFGKLQAAYTHIFVIPGQRPEKFLLGESLTTSNGASATGMFYAPIASNVAIFTGSMGATNNGAAGTGTVVSALVR